MVAWGFSVVCSVVAMLGVVSFQMTNRFEARLIDSTEQLLRVVESQALQAVRADDIGRMSETVHALDGVPGIAAVSLFHRPTRSYFRASSPWPEAINQPPDALDRAVIESGEPGRADTDTRLRIAVPLREVEGGPVQGVLAIEVARPTRFAIALDLMADNLLAGLFAVGGALLLSLVLGRATVRPIEAAIRVADRVAEGDLVMPEPIGGSREAVRLEQSLARMIFRLEQSHLRIRDLAFRDQITRLSNRTDFNLRGRAMMHGGEHDCEHLLRALFFLDLDGFKAVNDTYGHEIGDAALREVADRLREVVRPDDELRNASRIAGALGDGPEVAPLMARLGGDEFTLLLSCLNAPGDAEVVAGRVLEAISRPMQLSGHSVTLGISIGIALSEPGGGEDFSELLRRADVAMYAAKKAGKNRYRVFEPSMDQRIVA